MNLTIHHGFCWRSKRDLNSRGGFPPYALSRGASSTSWVLLHKSKWFYIFTCYHKMAERMGFEPMVRSRESLVFKTSSINHSDTSPQWLPPECRYYYTKIWRGCQPLRANFFENYFACESHGEFFPVFCSSGLCFGPFSPKKRKNRRSVTPRRENFRGLF